MDNSNLPLFTNPRKFSGISGLPVEEIRNLCRLQILPCERTKHQYRIDTLAAIEVLKQRAADRTGHKYDTILVRRCDPPKLKDTESYLKRLDSMKRTKVG